VYLKHRGGGENPSPVKGPYVQERVRKSVELPLREGGRLLGRRIYREKRTPRPVRERLSAQDCLHGVWKRKNGPLVGRTVSIEKERRSGGEAHRGV